MLGFSKNERLLAVIYAERDEVIRTVSARPATSRKRRDYEEDA